MKRSLFLILIIPFFAFAQQNPMRDLSNMTKGTIYTKKDPPKTPELKKLLLRDTVTQYGITWKFDKKVPIGQFINGDYYVVGAVTVVSITPNPMIGKDIPKEELDVNEAKKVNDVMIRNGSMLNPPAKQEMAYDSGIRNWYKLDMITNVPYELKPTDCLVSSISLKKGENINRIYNGEAGSPIFRAHEDDSPVKTMAVLTCVAEPLPPDAFRPSYCDRAGKIYYARDLKRELLPNLERVISAPGSLELFIRLFQRPWVDTGFFGFGQPLENMPLYGREVGRVVGWGALMLMQKYPPQDKERLLINYVQVGIDYWGVVKSGHPGWAAYGGHGSGRKINMVIAGILLGDEQMASPTKSFPEVRFQEDMHTIYDNSWTGAFVVYSGHLGSEDGKRRAGLKQLDWNSYEHLYPQQWDGKTGENYRRCCTSVAWVGQALAMRLLHAEQNWNHDAFFDYMDRWMYEDDSAAVEELKKLGMDYSATWARQGQAWGSTSAPVVASINTSGSTAKVTVPDKMVEDMWAKYRKTLEAPIDGWKTQKK